MSQLKYPSLLFALVSMAACSFVPSPAPTQVAAPQQEAEAQRSLEYQLAVINGNGFVAEGDISITRFRYLLNSLKKKTGYTEQQIADLCVYAVNTIREKYGKNIKLRDFMERANDEIRAVPKADFKKLVAVMIEYYGR